MAQDAVQLFFEDTAIGQETTPLTRGPISPLHLMRWSSAIENWHRIHYDVPFATEHDGLPNILVNGSWKQHFLVQMIQSWLGQEGWLWTVSFKFLDMDQAGDVLTAWGKVTGAELRGDLGVVTCEIGIRNHRGFESTSGLAEGVLPRRDGPAVPYPFSGSP